MPGVTAAAPGLQALQQRRYQLVPQMKDYDRLAEKKWLPYLMFFQPPGLKTASFTTDEQGFRGTLDQGKPVAYSRFHAAEQPRGVLLGASTAFGVGAGSDGATLASRLNGGGGRLWFNYSGRAFNSTQELMIFLLHLPERVDNVLLFSGVNHLVLSHLSRETSPVYNSFFFQSMFERGMSGESQEGRGGLWRLLKGEFRRSSEEEQEQSAPRQSESERYENGLACMRRDMRLWALLREAMGFKLHFVFQPVLPWIEKPLAPEEKELFGLTDKLFPEESANGFMEFLVSRAKRFTDDAKAICRAQEVPFLDLNAGSAFTRPDWLFVDRVHLTDAGYALARQEIGKAFSI